MNDERIDLDDLVNLRYWMETTHEELGCSTEPSNRHLTMIDEYKESVEDYMAALADVIEKNVGIIVGDRRYEIADIIDGAECDNRLIKFDEFLSMVKKDKDGNLFYDDSGFASV